MTYLNCTQIVTDGLLEFLEDIIKDGEQYAIDDAVLASDGVYPQFKKPP